MAVLTKGDIAFTSFNADEDGFSLVTFVDIDPSTTIYFTDNEATGTTGGVTSFSTNESFSKWVSPVTTVAAGTVIRFSTVDNLTLLAASVGSFTRETVTGSANWGIAGGGDAIYAFLGSSATNATTILTAISSGDTVIPSTGGAATTAAIFTNAELTVGTNAVQLRTSADYAEYGTTVAFNGTNVTSTPTNSPRSGQSSFADYKPFVFNASNWSVDQNDGIYATTTAVGAAAPSPTVVPNTTAFTISATRNDFNGDGKSDILWRNNNSAVAIWQMDGNTVTSTAGLLSVVTNDWQIAGTADFNNDKKSDILWRDRNNGAVAIWQMNGNTVSTSGVAGSATLDWQIAGTGDFSGDGKSDILWRDRNNGAVAIWQMDGNTVMSTSGVASLATLDWQIEGTGDFNGDGKSDILWRDRNNGAVAIWQMNGNTVSTSGVASSATMDWKIAGTGDFNGDGKSDILWRNDNGSVAIWQMDGNTVTSTSGVTSSAAADWQIAGTGDFNNDKKSDILWRNELGSSVAVWNMDGSTVLTGSGLFASGNPGVINTTATADWKISAPIL
jgi:FG-GAP-like repeat